MPEAERVAESRPTSTNFAQLHKQVCFGRSGGRIIWQPRIHCWIDDRLNAGRPLPPPFTGMDAPDIYRELGCSARIYDYRRSFERVEHPAVHRTERELSHRDREITVHTPVGKQVAVRRLSEDGHHWIHLKREAETEDELKVMTWRAENTDWRWNQEAYEAAQRTWGDLGAPTTFLQRVNVQYLYLNAMGTEKAIYALQDWPDAVETFFRALNESQRRLMDVVASSPIEIINFGDNVHAGTLPPRLFREYVLPVYQERCDRLHSAGKFLHAHWDGDTKPLLPFARETGLDGIEAITPKPQGDVTLEEIKEALGDEMFLIDGVPAILFDRTFPVAMLEDCVHRLIEMFAPRLILGISDELSSTGDMERVRLVGRMVDEYNASFASVKGAQGE